MPRVSNGIRAQNGPLIRATPAHEAPDGEDEPPGMAEKPVIVGADVEVRRCEPVDVASAERRTCLPDFAVRKPSKSSNHLVALPVNCQKFLHPPGILALLSTPSKSQLSYGSQYLPTDIPAAESATRFVLATPWDSLTLT